MNTNLKRLYTKTTLFALGFIGLLMIFSSCKKTKDKVDEFTQFDLSYSTNFSVPSSSTTNFSTPNIATNTGSSYPNNKTTYELVDEVKLTKFNVVASAGNFDYLKSLTIFMQADGLPESQIATISNIPTGVSNFDMTLNDVNLKDYFAKTNFKMRVNVVIDGAISVDQNMKLNQTLHVVAKILD
jgi:hypothetical protein